MPHATGGTLGRTLALLVVLILGAALVWGIVSRLSQSKQAARAQRQPGPVPVEAAEVRTGLIVDRRVFNGTLRARAAFDVAPKISGRIERLTVDIGDEIARDAVIAELDSDEYDQAVLEAQADLAVAQAEQAQAHSALQIAEREYERLKSLREKGIASESEYDAARSVFEARSAALDVAKAQVQRRQSLLRTAEIRRDYTNIKATWSEGDARRVVGERYAEEGDTVAANQPIVTVLEIDVVLAVVTVTESDYGRMRLGQGAALRVDAYADRTFEAKVVRLSPQFSAQTRQANIELRAENPGRLLKPGMFVRVEVALDRAEGATIVPIQALVKRGGEQGVFVIAETGDKVRWAPVKVGITEGEEVQVVGEGVSGRVVTLGQQLITDGAAVRVSAGDSPPAGVAR